MGGGWVGARVGVWGGVRPDGQAWWWLQAAQSCVAPRWAALLQWMRAVMFASSNASPCSSPPTPALQERQQAPERRGTQRPPPPAPRSSDRPATSQPQLTPPARPAPSVNCLPPPSSPRHSLAQGRYTHILCAVHARVQSGQVHAHTHTQGRAGTVCCACAGAEWAGACTHTHAGQGRYCVLCMRGCRVVLMHRRPIKGTRPGRQRKGCACAGAARRARSRSLPLPPTLPPSLLSRAPWRPLHAPTLLPPQLRQGACARGQANPLQQWAGGGGGGQGCASARRAPLAAPYCRNQWTQPSLAYRATHAAQRTHTRTQRTHGTARTAPHAPGAGDQPVRAGLWEGQASAAGHRAQLHHRASACQLVGHPHAVAKMLAQQHGSVLRGL